MVYYYEIKKGRKTNELTLIGPLEGIYELKRVKGQDAPSDFAFIQVIDGNPIRSFTRAQVHVVKERIYGPDEE